MPLGIPIVLSTAGRGSVVCWEHCWEGPAGLCAADHPHNVTVLSRRAGWRICLVRIVACHLFTHVH